VTPTGPGSDTTTGVGVADGDGDPVTVAVASPVAVALGVPLPAAVPVGELAGVVGAAVPAGVVEAVGEPGASSFELHADASSSIAAKNETASDRTSAWPRMAATIRT
jgi:hypothetical protein